MTLDLEYREETRTDFALGMLGGVKLNYDRSVFRRYHVDTVGKPLNETNLYTYTRNNPVNFTDSKGLSIDSVDFTVDLTIVGAGEAIKTCCDKNNKKHRATYHKFCYGFSVGAIAASFGAPITQGECPPQNGWSNDVGGALGAGWGTSWGGGDASQGPNIGVGGGYMRCYYYLWNDQITGCCDQ